MQHCLVTGAAGMLGEYLCRALLERGCRVRALVHRAPLELRHPQLEIVTGDITDAGRMRDVCEGIDTVFHTAAAVMLLGGRHARPAYREQAYRVNVDGTDNLLAASRRHGVQRFVYTSSVDVCFDGRPNTGMNQSTPYARRCKSVYQETKIAAEKAVLAANGREGLYTCAIRPDGIWGPRPGTALDTLVEMAGRGAMKFTIGRPGTQQDNSYIDNLVHAHLLAAEHLGAGGSASGKAYFITDEAPQGIFEFYRPVFDDLGLPFPRYRIPRWVVYSMALAGQFLHFRLGTKPPMFTPHVVDKITVSHYGSNEDAVRDLGYRPAKTYREAIEDCLPYCRRRLEELQGKYRSA